MVRDMPLYEFYNTETKELEDHLVKLADYDEFLENNPHLENESLHLQLQVVMVIVLKQMMVLRKCYQRSETHIQLRSSCKTW